jgi:UDP:flavonoid glycosyltransferase YjiC (YdhE family)
MAKILLAWEFGAGAGHLARLAPAARDLAARGHDLVAALPPGRRLAQIPVIEAPAWTSRPAWAPVESLAQALAQFGFADRSAVAAALARWDRILAAESPDAILADFAPALAAAARGRVPVVMVGNGHTLPPPGRLLPPLRPWQKSLSEDAAAAEAACLAALPGPPARLADLLAGDSPFLFCLEELDLYREFREPGSAIPPYSSPLPLPGAEARADEAILHLPLRHPAREAALSALAAAGLRVHVGPVDLAELAPRARVILHHGGLGTAASALAAGTPQLVLPRLVEHLVIGWRLARLGAARVLEPGGTPPLIEAKLARMLRDLPDAMPAARQLAARDPAGAARRGYAAMLGSVTAAAAGGA